MLYSKMYVEYFVEQKDQFFFFFFMVINVLKYLKIFVSIVAIIDKLAKNFLLENINIFCVFQSKCQLQ